VAPLFALERLEQASDDRLIYHFPKPQPEGRTELRRTLLELMEPLVALIPPPSIRRHRDHRVAASPKGGRADIGQWCWVGRRPEVAVAALSITAICKQRRVAALSFLFTRRIFPYWLEAGGPQ